jgi:hypothetical protein
MKKILLYLFLTVILAGCFPATGHWIKKPSQTSDEYWDREDCNRCALEHIWRIERGFREPGLVDYLLWVKLVGKGVAVSEGFGDDIRRFYFNKCMEAKGYKWEVDEVHKGKSKP